MTEYAGRGDPRRSMALLWGRCEPRTKGPKPGITLADIVATAVALADEEGLDAVSMRRIAERLGRSPMSLYTYVPSKAELVDLMLEHALGELPTSYDRSRGWRAAAEEWARTIWAFYERHPWVLQISGARALLSPNEFAQFEVSLAIFDGLGLTGFEQMHAANAVKSFVWGAAKALADIDAAEAATGVSEDEWWNTRSALLAEVAGDGVFEAFPTISKLDGEGVFLQPDRPDPEVGYLEQDAIDTFTVGLSLLLDGIEARVEARSRRRRSPARAKRGAG